MSCAPLCRGRSGRLDARLVPLHDVQIWFRPTASLDDAAIADAESVLSDDERAQCRRFHVARDARDYAAAHALLRPTLSRHDGREPRSWRFEKTPNGKPFLTGAGDFHASFSLSHTRGMVACAVTAGADVGVDVESVDREVDTAAIASRFFAPQETAHLMTLAPDARRNRFFDFWTLKEALVKALGEGMAVSLNLLALRSTATRRWCLRPSSIPTRGNSACSLRARPIVSRSPSAAPPPTAPDSSSDPPPTTPETGVDPRRNDVMLTRFWRVLLHVLALFAVLLLSVALDCGPRVHAQVPPPKAIGLSPNDRHLVLVMLRQVREDVEKNYYDPAFRGIDLKAKFDAAERQLASAPTLADAFSLIADPLFQLDDSHTAFIPPNRRARIDYGWRMTIVGDVPFITTVDPESDAAAKGLAAGDRVLLLNAFAPTRSNVSRLAYFYRFIRPEVQQRVAVLKPDGSARTVDVVSRVENKRTADVYDLLDDVGVLLDRARDRSAAAGDAVLVWRMAVFGQPESVERMIAKARGFKTLVLESPRQRRRLGGGAARARQPLHRPRRPRRH